MLQNPDSIGELSEDRTLRESVHVKSLEIAEEPAKEMFCGFQTSLRLAAVILQVMNLVIWL